MAMGFMFLEICCIAGALTGNRFWLLPTVVFAVLGIWFERMENNGV